MKNTTVGGVLYFVKTGMSLYLKYRPKTFLEMVGQRHILDILLAQMQKKEFASSYLLYGPRGTGKTSTARLLAKLVNCTTFTEDGQPDLANDPQAKLIDEGKTLDFVEIDAASHTGVDNIREEIIDKALYPPTALKMKVYVIDEVHMLSKGAFNALLKIMEEPRDYLMFVLATTEIHKVPDTIISRCQVFNFKHLTIEQIVERLQKIADAEGIQYETSGLELIAKLSHGALRDGIKYLEQISILGSITQENVATFLGVVADSVIEEFIDTVIEGNAEKIFSQLDSFVERGVDFGNLVKDILIYLDEHFMENPTLFAPMAGMLQEIAANTKRYPQPILLWKRKLWLRCQEMSGGVAVHATHTPVPVAPKKIEAISQVSAPTTEPVSQTSPVETPGPASQPPLQKPETPVPVEKAPVPSSSGSFDGDLSDLLQNIADRVDKMMLKSVLKKQSLIKSFENGVMTIVVINQQFYSSVQKPDIVQYMEKIVSEVVGQPVSLKWEYMSKEDFMKQQLQGF